MNERIREFAQQAGADFMRRINYNNLEGKEYEEDAGVIFDSNDSFEKFVELIVQECVDVCLERHRHWRWDNEPDSASGPRDCAQSIKQHFGVE
jgi:hypothetical protein